MRVCRTHKGFTLIELLVVVVIIAVMAALIIARFMGQSERAVIAEGISTLSTMRRAEKKWMDMTSSAGQGLRVQACGFTQCTGAAAASWGSLGMKPPRTQKFDFSCDPAGFCTATRRGGSAYENAAMTLTYFGADDGQFGCDGVLYVPAAGNNTGCIGA